MARVTFKNSTNDIIKKRFVTKTTFKRLVLAQVATLLLLSGCLARLYYLRDLDPVISKITTYYTILEQVIKGLF